MKIETKMIKMREELEKSNDEIMPLLEREYHRVDDELKLLYQRVSQMPEEELVSFLETQKLLAGAERTELKYFLILVAGLALVGGNRRKVNTKIGIHNILARSSARQSILFDSHFEGVVGKVFNYDVLKKNIPLSTKEMRRILDYRLKNVHYSSRIWKNTTGLNDKLYNIFTEGFSKGFSASRMASNLSSVTGVGFFKSMRLLKTELTAVVTNAQLSYFGQVGVKRVRHESVLDNRTSQICEERDGMIINVADAVVGENVPPLHPYCRSIIVPLTD